MPNMTKQLLCAWLAPTLLTLQRGWSTGTDAPSSAAPASAVFGRPSSLGGLLAECPPAPGSEASGAVVGVAEPTLTLPPLYMGWQLPVLASAASIAIAWHAEIPAFGLGFGSHAGTVAFGITHVKYAGH
jgi:hypothetical protein